MKEIKVMVFEGNLAELARQGLGNAVLQDRFAQQKGFTVQQFAYTCAISRDEVRTVYGQAESVVVDFSIRVMRAEQTLFYEKLKDLASSHYSFVFNGVFDNGWLKYYDNAITVDGFVVDVEEKASNDKQQALMFVKLLARQLTYVHRDGSELVLDISQTS